MPTQKGYGKRWLVLAAVIGAATIYATPLALAQIKKVWWSTPELRVQAESLKDGDVGVIKESVADIMNKRLKKLTAAAQELDDATKELVEAQKSEDAARATRLEKQAKVLQLQEALMKAFSEAASKNEEVKEAPREEDAKGKSTSSESGAKTPDSI